MKMIFKIAAGVLIGLLAYQIILYQNIDYQNTKYQKAVAHQQAEYEKLKTQVNDAHILKIKFKLLNNAITSYYRKNKTLPKFISDLKCLNIHGGQENEHCAERYDDGVFYVNHGKEWASAEPYIFDEKIYSKCKSSITLSKGNGIYQNCEKLDTSSIARKTFPPFKCDDETSGVEKIICQSDKLTANEIKLSLIYTTLLEQDSKNSKKIIENKTEFINLRRKRCSTSKCIESMTLKKILRLEFLGVWKKDRSIK